MQFIVWYTGQTGRQLITRFSEHQRYIQNNNPESSYALHILNKTGIGKYTQYNGSTKTCKKRRRMNCWEALYVQTFQQQGLLVQEQHTRDLKPLYTLVQDIDRYTADDIHKTGQQT